MYKYMIAWLRYGRRTYYLKNNIITLIELRHDATEMIQDLFYIQRD